MRCPTCHCPFEYLDATGQFHCRCNPPGRISGPDGIEAGALRWQSQKRPYKKKVRNSTGRQAGKSSRHGVPGR